MLEAFRKLGDLNAGAALKIGASKIAIVSPILTSMYSSKNQSSNHHYRISEHLEYT